MEHQVNVNYTLNSILALPGIKKTGESKWIAKCPAHDDKTPSLGIRLLDDGGFLLHCFAGCSIEEIVSAIGIEMTDLFPAEPENRSTTRWDPRQVLRCLRHESLVVVFAAESIKKSGELKNAELDRLVLAIGRIGESIRMAGLER